MAVKKRGLGRGLDALLSGPSVSALEEQAVKIDQKELQHLLDQLKLELPEQGPPKIQAQQPAPGPVVKRPGL